MNCRHNNTRLIAVGYSKLARCQDCGAAVMQKESMYSQTKISETNEAALAKVIPTLAARVRRVIAAAAEDGFTLMITQGLRTFREQEALYAKGRTTPGKKVTNARGGQSMHNYGLAVDLAFIVKGDLSWDEKLYRNIGKWAAAEGLEWGGNWKFTDLPHVQFVRGLSWQTCKDYYQRGGVEAVWNVVGGKPAIPKPVDEIQPRATDAFPELSIGSKGPLVGRLQQQLAVRKFFFEKDIDNDFGRLTRNAVILFQRSKGLTDDGIVGAKTAALLGLI